MAIADEFRSYPTTLGGNLFEQLYASVEFEKLGKGREGAVLTKPDESRGVPIVRTTSKFINSAQCFRSVHLQLAQEIKDQASHAVNLNNALVETYTDAYFKMGFHSDQALDLVDDSVIVLFSCYKHPKLATPTRTLAVESKKPSDGGLFEIPLEHQSFVVFSVDTNRRFKHKIVLNKSNNPPENQWLGITFRTSKTFIKFCDNRVSFEDGSPIALADDSLKREYFALRARENAESDFSYPKVGYTISESDLKAPGPP